ncbi:hypothetical protein BX661DRAFT_205423 [Kickxella alabastrina]|uniref:uncharacterized protein n=1 Tax=Kickxella alabastrina TaxID=61397 RepID=UPI00221F238B|nr:uncharacterized protein BX661DRAFT_205423 [Kickxella alabastrina]KAI7827829.1 hypothetical protein BX661DRAFT_205423 [Kickxella alabastrina]
MDGYSPAAATIIEHALQYLTPREIAACQTVNRAWYALTAVQSVRHVDCHIMRLALRLAHYRRKGLAGAIRGLTIDVGFVDGFLSAPMYEQRIRDAVAAVHGSGARVRRIKIHMDGARSALTNSELRFGALACELLLRALPGLVALDLSECPAALLAGGGDEAGGPLAQQVRLQHVRWFSLGRNDMSSAAALCCVVAANRHSLRALYGRGDITDRALALLCNAPNLLRLDASGSSISDDALLALVRARGGDLRELILSDCSRLTRLSIAQLTPRLLPRLAALDLYNVMVTTDSYQSLFNVATRWPYLRDLKLKAAIPHTSPRQDSLVNDDILIAIGRNCPRLVSLRLFGCHGITDDGLSAILGNLGYLRELVVMHNATDAGAGAGAARASRSQISRSQISRHGQLQRTAAEPAVDQRHLGQHPIAALKRSAAAAGAAAYTAAPAPSRRHFAALDGTWQPVCIWRAAPAPPKRQRCARVYVAGAAQRRALKVLQPAESRYGVRLGLRRASGAPYPPARALRPHDYPSRKVSHRDPVPQVQDDGVEHRLSTGWQALPRLPTTLVYMSAYAAAYLSLYQYSITY